MLNNRTLISKIDLEKMQDILYDFPGQCAQAVRNSENLQIPDEFLKKLKTIVVCGQGGSAIGGEILQTLLEKTSSIPVLLNRKYTLPHLANERTLILLVSYSGNTEETISAYQEARKRDCLLWCVSSGGELSKLSKNDGVPWTKIPGGMPPRTCLGYLFIPLVRIGEKIGLIKEQNYRELEDKLRDLRKTCSLAVDIENNPAKSLARQLKGKIPLIYGIETVTGVVAHRWKTQFNENSKMFAFWDVLPELDHNEVVPWGERNKFDPKLFHVIIIGEKDGDPKISKRIQVTSSLIERRGNEVTQIWAEGESLLSKILSIIYLGDWVSFYLAILNQVDPTPVAGIDLLKRELAKL